jgi:hypothetical protein
VYGGHLIIDFDDIKDLHALDGFPLKNVTYAIVQAKKIKVGNYFIAENNAKLSESDISLQFYDLSENVLAQDRHEYLDISAFMSESWSNEPGMIWLSESAGHKYGLQAGDKLTYVISDTQSMKLTVAGIFSDDLNDKTIYIADCIMPFEAAYHIALQKDIDITFTARGQLLGLSDYTTVYNQSNLIGIGVSGIGSSEQLLRMAETVQFICVGLACTLTVCAAFIIGILLRMVLNTRMEYIAMCKTLGMPDRNLIDLYFGVSECLALVSIGLALILSSRINRALTSSFRVMLNAEDFDLNNTFPILCAIIFGTQILLICWRYMIKHHIGNVNSLIQSTRSD